jgi:hypothetical protein
MQAVETYAAGRKNFGGRVNMAAMDAATMTPEARSFWLSCIWPGITRCE